MVLALRNGGDRSSGKFLAAKRDIRGGRGTSAGFIFYREEFALAQQFEGRGALFEESPGIFSNRGELPGK